MSKISNLIKLHDAHSKQTKLPKVLGDGYLFSKNLVFNRVRKKVLGYGYRFEPAPLDYVVFPLAALDSILHKRRIPYFSNAPALKKIEEVRAGQFSFSDLPGFRANHLLHESAHCLSNEIFRKVGEIIPPHKKNLNLACASYSGEALANTLECLAYAFADNRPHYDFVSANCYQFSEESIDFTRKLRSAVGLRDAISIIFASFFCSNILIDEVTEPDIKRILAAFGLNSNPNASHRKLFKKAFCDHYFLSKDFTIKTAFFYFKSHGVADPLGFLAKFEPWEFFERKNWMSYVTGLHQILDE